jgi:predicted transcriptional regulator
MMERTQIYLTREEREALKSLSERLGQSQSEIIREAIDQYIVQITRESWEEALDRAFGVWADHEDLPDINALREEVDERLERLYS